MYDRPSFSAEALLRHQLTAATGRGLAPALLTTLIASVLAFPVAAQDNQDAQESEVIEEVIVTGYRQSILSAIDAKRMADTVVETL